MYKHDSKRESITFRYVTHMAKPSPKFRNQ